MNVRIGTGTGITGLCRYVQGEGRDPVTNQPIKPAPAQKSRATLIGGTGFGFRIITPDRAEIARKVMEYKAANQGPKTRKCRQVCVHLVLTWPKSLNPTVEEKNEAAQSALEALGMSDAMSLIYSHSDEDYHHIHIIALGVHPVTCRAFDLYASQRKLSAWALQYEIDHGGVINTRRQTANELRQAIARRDAGAVLEALTKQCAVFTPARLKRAVHMEINWRTGATSEQQAAVRVERSRFEAEVLAHPEIVGLAEEPGGPLACYTTRAVLAAENHVLSAAKKLAASNRHACGEDHQARLEASNKYCTMTAEQLSAFLRATGPEGLTLIDGQAGTGKSYCVEAIREAYEQTGYRMIGLAPTNIVKEDMKASGFGHAATVHKELFNLANGRTAWSRDTVVIVDEAAMLDTRMMALLTTAAAEAVAKLILIGDDRQLSSIDRGGMFAVLKRDHGAAVLSEVKRQYKIDERRASEMMAEGNYHHALGIYDQKGAICWTRTEREARAALIRQWAEDTARDPGQSRFVFAYTNDAVDELNTALRSVRQERGELGPDHEFATAYGRRRFALGDRIQFTTNDSRQGIVNGRGGTIAAIDDRRIAVSLDTPEPTTITFDAEKFKDFRHGYAGTIYKSQGKTLHETYLFHSEHWRAAPGYVALTRHRAQTRLFVARNTARNLAELARQIARSDERRAASQFFPVEPIDPAPPLSAAELNARFAARYARRRHDSNSRDPANDNQTRASNDNRQQGRHLETSLTTPGTSPFGDGRRRQAQTLDQDHLEAVQTTNAPPLAPVNQNFGFSAVRPDLETTPFHAPVCPAGAGESPTTSSPAVQGRARQIEHHPYPTPPAAPDRLEDSGQPEFIANTSLPPLAAASPPPQRNLRPKVGISKPAPGSRTSIRKQFGEAKRLVTRRTGKTERLRKRKQQEDAGQLFISAKAIMKCLARTARRTWKFFWERETPATPCLDMRLDPRYRDWYAGDPATDNAASHNQATAIWPSHINRPSLNL